MCVSFSYIYIYFILWRYYIVFLIIFSSCVLRLYEPKKPVLFTVG